LHQRYAFYLITSLGAAIFFSGLDPKGMRSWKVPLAIAGTLCIAFSAILLMYVFFLYAAGCYFHSTKATGESKRFLLIMSGALFALAAFIFPSRLRSLHMLFHLRGRCDGSYFEILLHLSCSGVL
jgi:hypothetical protein